MSKFRRTETIAARVQILADLRMNPYSTFAQLAMMFGALGEPRRSQFKTILRDLRSEGLVFVTGTAPGFLYSVIEPSDADDLPKIKRTKAADAPRPNIPHFACPLTWAMHHCLGLHAPVPESLLS